jgi:hypothetical protein
MHCLKDPIAKVSHVVNSASSVFDYDEAYTKSIQSRLTQMHD